MIPHTDQTNSPNDVATANVYFSAEAGQTLNMKLQDTTGSRILSRPELCSMLNISNSTSERWDRECFGPRPIKIGPRRVGYRLADVLAFIEARQSVAA